MGGVAYNIVSSCTRIPKKDSGENRKRKSEIEGNRPLETQFANKRRMSPASKGRTIYTRELPKLSLEGTRVALPRGLAAPLELFELSTPFALRPLVIFSEVILLSYIYVYLDIYLSF